jgi:hypothetical protein
MTKISNAMIPPMKMRAWAAGLRRISALAAAQMPKIRSAEIAIIVAAIYDCANEDDWSPLPPDPPESPDESLLH